MAGVGLPERDYSAGIINAALHERAGAATLKAIRENRAGVRRIHHSIQAGTRFGLQVLRFIPARKTSPILLVGSFHPKAGTLITVVQP
jgi:hypothetical protein